MRPFGTYGDNLWIRAEQLKHDMEQLEPDSYDWYRLNDELCEILMIITEAEAN